MLLSDRTYSEAVATALALVYHAGMDTRDTIDLTPAVQGPRNEVHFDIDLLNKSPELRIGRYIDMSEDQFLMARHDHPYCKFCQIPARDATEHDRERFRRALAIAKANTVLATVRTRGLSWKRWLGMSAKSS
jgi:hypothetical protein